MPRRKDGVFKQCPCPPEVDCVKRHGTWTYQVRLGVDPLTGKRIRRKKGGFRTRKEAVEARARLLAEAGEGPLANDRNLTVGRYLDQWYQALESRPDPPEYKTLQGYASNIRIWKPLIGHIRLQDLSREHINEALRRLAEPRSDDERPSSGRYGQWKAKREISTLDRYRATLRRALTIAVEKNLVRANVAAGHLDALDRPKAARVTVPRTVWAGHQTAQFFDHIADHPWALLYGSYALTGARRAEWVGAQWARLSPPGDSLYIGPTVVTGSGDLPCHVCGGTHRGILFKPLPKSANSFRWLPLPDQLRDALRQHRRAQAKTPVPNDWVDHDLIFPDELGGPIHPDEVTNEFNRLVAEAGLPPLTGVHALRHNAVSMMLHMGVPVEEVAKVTGHDVATLRRHYAHIIEKYARQSVQAHADAVLGRAWRCSDPAASHTGSSVTGRLRLVR